LTNAEVIAVGDELTSGQRVDTNSQWLSQRLAESGIRALFHTTVGDELEANVRVFQQAFERADVVLCTGGLGPTADDLTRESLAAATGAKLVSDPHALAQIRAMFARRKRPMPERNVVQAMFPESSQPIPNEHGTAPGVQLQVAREGRAPCYVFAMPGVPAEMRAMWEQSVSLSLANLQTGPRTVICQRSIKCFGVGESDLEQLLPDLTRRGRVPTVGITASRTTLTLRVTARGSTREACERLMAPTIHQIHETLGHLVFGYDDDELQDAVVHRLRADRLTLATAEIGSGGAIAGRLSDADQARSAFLGGWVVRPPAGERDDFEKAGVGSSGDTGNAITADQLFDRTFSRFQSWDQVVTTYAQRVRELLGADIGLALGPFPHSDSETTVPGDVSIALATAGRVLSRTYPFVGHPAIVEIRAANKALDVLRLSLLGESSG